MTVRLVVNFTKKNLKIHIYYSVANIPDNTSIPGLTSNITDFEKIKQVQTYDGDNHSPINNIQIQHVSEIKK